MDVPRIAGSVGFGGDAGMSWFADRILNAGVNCLDRHLSGRGDQTALIQSLMGSFPVVS